jgi:hypothetical protein
MESMLASAQDEGEVRAALQAFSDAGFRAEDPRAIALAEQGPPAAWWIRAGTPR